MSVHSLQRPRTIRVAALFAAAAFVGALPSGALADVLPPELAGEHYETYSSADVSFVVTNRTCNPGGQSTLTYIATGPATGPYTGRFREEGTVRVGPQTLFDVEGNPFGLVTSYEATFRIDSVSPAATVTGTKSLSDFPVRDMVGWCLDRPASTVADEWSSQNQPLRYTAVIAVGGARYADAGAARGGIFANVNTVSPIFDAGVLDAYFFGDSVPPVALDSTPPDASPQISPAPNAAGWNTGDVTVTWNWSDSGSGLDLASGCPSTTTSAGEGAAIVVSASCADNTGNSATRQVVVKVDKAAPVVVLSGVQGSYTVDELVAISCSATDPGAEPSGLAATTCPGLNAPAYMLGLGTHSLLAGASDNAGNVGYASATFSVLVTPKSLCNLTTRLVIASPARATGACTLLSHVFAAANPGHKASLIAAYQRVIAALAAGGWLTTHDATVLTDLANGLSVA